MITNERQYNITRVQADFEHLGIVSRLEKNPVWNSHGKCSNLMWAPIRSLLQDRMVLSKVFGRDIKRLGLGRLQCRGGSEAHKWGMDDTKEESKPFSWTKEDLQGLESFLSANRFAK